MVRTNRQRTIIPSKAIMLPIFHAVMHSFLFVIACLFFLTGVLFFTEFSLAGELLDYVMIAITLIGIFSSSVIAGYKVKSKGLIIGFSIGLIYFILASSIALLCGESSLEISVLLNKGTFSVLAGILGGVIGVNL